MSAEKDNNQAAQEEQEVNTPAEQVEGADVVTDTESLPEAETTALAQAEEELTEMKDKYLRLFAEFDNYKRRTSKERMDLLKMANQEMMVALLPVVDDFERARQAMQATEDVSSVKEGVELIFSKLIGILQQKGLKPMDAVGTAFDPDLHEAITQIPAPDDSLKGKVIDEVEKGYLLNDKVVRYAKVVTGA
jgi:molecular chaperone GrpE